MRQHALGGLEAGFVGHRVRGLDQFDALRQAFGPRRDVVVARDHQAFDSFASAGHSASSACAIEPPALPAPSTRVRPLGGLGR